MSLINQDTSASRSLGRLRVMTEPKPGNRMHRTRTLSELILISPRNSSRISPRSKRFDMDIEVSMRFANGEQAGNVMESQELTKTQEPASASQVINMLFEIHTALKSRHYGQRTAASALAACNIVSIPKPSQQISKEEELEILDSTKKMLECAICQEIFSDATEATCCGQIFCKDCIERWVSERKSCPMCRENIGFTLLKPSRHAQRMANEMHVTCPYCNETVKKAILSAHIGDCAMAPAVPPPPSYIALRHNLLTFARLSAANLTRYLLAPANPEALTMQCYIRTHGSGHYELYTQNTNTLLCRAMRRRQYDMSISFSIYLADDLASGASSMQVARLDKNFMGSQYTMHKTEGNESFEMGAVQYAATFGKSPRQMRVALPPVQRCAEIIAGTPEYEMQPWISESKDDTILAQLEQIDSQRAVTLINKPPVWIESLEAYCLDFGGRVAAASVKNFLLSHPNDMEKTLMLFGRTQDRQIYSMDYSHPFSPAQAFCIALSSMDSHLVTFD